MKVFHKRNNCRICKYSLSDGVTLASYQDLLIPGLFFDNHEISHNYKSDLEVVECSNCKTVQLFHDIDSAVYKFYKSGAPNKAHFDHLKNVSNLFSQNINHNSEILEIGGGVGYFLKELSKNGFKNLWNIDPSDEAINNLEFKSIKGVFPDAIKESKWENKFDVIIGQHFLEHVSEPLQVLKSVNNILKDNGEFWIEVPDITTTAANAFLLSIIYSLHSTNFDEYSLGNLAINTGFKIDKFYQVNHYGKSVIAVLKKSYFTETINLNRESINKRNNEIIKYFKTLEDFCEKLPNSSIVWGAAERCTVMLSIFLNNGFEVIDIFDSNAELVTKFIPGLKNSIKSPSVFPNNPDDLLILSPTNHLSIIQAIKHKLSDKTMIHIPLIGHFTFKEYGEKFFN